MTGYACTSYNAYYYQCVPGTATTSVVSSTSSGSSSPASTTSTTASSTNISTSSSSSASPTTTAPATTSTSGTGATGSGTPTTLLSGWYWIRAVESPYYHSYLQTQPTAAPGDGVLDAGATAGQFNILDGQLVYNTGGGAADGALYMSVEDPADTSQRALRTWFNTTENTYGTFAFSGDTVTWQDPDVPDRNEGAFYVCPSNSTSGSENALFVNTGAYDYDTPSGCYGVDVSLPRAWMFRPFNIFSSLSPSARVMKSGQLLFD